MKNTSTQPSPRFFQYVNVTLSNGTHEFTYKKFLEIFSKDGITEEEIITFLRDYHDVTEATHSVGLKDGFYWTEADTSAGVFPVRRGSDPEPRVFNSDEPEIAHLMEVAPELFEYNW